MIQLSPATADFPTRKIIRYFSCGRREGTTRGWSKRGEKNARLFGAQELGGVRTREYPGKCKTTFKQRKDGSGSACSTFNERFNARREPMDSTDGSIHRENKETRRLRDGEIKILRGDKNLVFLNGNDRSILILVHPPSKRVN